MFEQILLVFVAVMAGIIGLLALRGSSANIVGRVSFFLVCICLSSWSLALGWFLSAQNVSALDVSSRIFYVSAAAFCPLLTVFAYYFPKSRDDSKSPLWIKLLLGLTLIYSLYIVFSRVFIIDTEKVSSVISMSNIPIINSSYALFSAFFVATFILFITMSLRARRVSSVGEKTQVSLFMVGVLVASIPGFIADLWMPSRGDYSVIWIGPLSILVFLGLIAYGVVKLGMFDIRAATARATVYALIIAALASIYFVLSYLFSLIFLSDGGELPVSPVSGLLAIVMALMFQPIRHFFDQFTDKVFYRGQISQDIFLREFGKILSYDTDLKLLLRQASKYIAENLRAEKVFFSVAGRGQYGVGIKGRALIPFGDIKLIEGTYNDNFEFPELMSAGSKRASSVASVMKVHHLQYVLPLKIQGQSIGHMFIGEHLSSGYSSREIKIIESIANELTIAVQNSLSVEEIRELNANLQNKVVVATEEIRKSNQQLQRLDEAKNEFISMASHQLRTPLTSIKGYLDMVLQGDLGKVSATQRSVLSEAFVSSERMVTLINDFLNISRLQTGKFVIEGRDGDLKEVIREQISMLKVVAKQHDIEIALKIDPKVPRMQIDTDKMRQVTLNFIDNAIYYSKPGSTIKVSLVRNKNQVEFNVKDTGIGVPKSEQDQLFSRFFRATNARQRRPDGTGVGLFLAKKVVTLHGGEITFKSEEGKGSTFGFRMPIVESRKD